MPEATKRTHDSRRSEFRRPGFVLSAIFVAGLAILAIVLSAQLLIESTARDPSVRQPGSNAIELDAETCPDSSRVGALAAQSVTMASWELVGTVAAPSMVNAGPNRVDDDGFRSCFARNEAGAVIAAANYVAVGSGRPELGRRLAAESVAPGLGREAAIRSQQSSSPEAEAEAEAEANGLQIAGYRVVNYDPDIASVDIVVRSDNGRLAAGTISLRWVEDDWLLAVDPSSGQTSTPQPISNLGGYTVWSESQ